MTLRLSITLECHDAATALVEANDLEAVRKLILTLFPQPITGAEVVHEKQIVRD